MKQSAIALLIVVNLVFFGFQHDLEEQRGEDVQAQPAISVARGGTIMVGGNPFFPIGSYHLPKSAQPYQELREAGFNLVQSPPTLEALDKAHKAGLMAWVTLAGDLDFSHEVEKHKANIRAAVNAVGNHPALLVWESRDEPAWTWKQPAKPAASADGLARGHQFLKSLDPNHPVWINHAPRNLVKTLVNFSRGVDIVSCDIYPIIPCGLQEMYAIQSDGTHGDLLNQTASAVGEYTDKMRRVAGPDRAVWMVLQGFAWEGAREPKKQDSTKILYPSYNETRFMAYDAVIHGANGILFWGTAYVPQPSEFWTNLKRVAKELSEMAPVFLAPTLKTSVNIEYAELGFSMDTAIETMIKNYNGKVYLITANISPYPARVTFSGLQRIKASKELVVFHEQRTVIIEDGTFMDYFEGFGVHVYVEK